MFPDPRPLVERLGREFFLEAPEHPGVYLMRDAKAAVLYVGKARNLRRRLNSYRVANPDRMPRRHLRLLSAVVEIELELCADETSALAREAELLLQLKPRFNRAGTWRGPDRWLMWRPSHADIEFAVGEHPESGWQAIGPMDSSAFRLRAALARLLWLATHPQLELAAMPFGWAEGKLERHALVRCDMLAGEVAAALENLVSGQAAAFSQWLLSKLEGHRHPFDLAAMELDLEYVLSRF